MIVKYKVSDFAKDLNVSAKKVLDKLNTMGSTGKKNSSNLEENELNYLLEKFSKAGSVPSLDEFLNSAKAPKEEPKSAAKKDAPKAERSLRTKSLRKRRQSPLRSPRQPTITTTPKSPSSTKSVRKRLFPSASWLVRPAQRQPLRPHRLFRCAVRIRRSRWIPVLWI